MSIVAFSGVLGSVGAPLGNATDESFGGAIGYRMFFNDDSTQLVAEIGAIESSAPTARVQDGVGVGLRFQQKFMERFLFQVDEFYTTREVIDNAIGVRAEVTVAF